MSRTWGNNQFLWKNVHEKEIMVSDSEYCVTWVSCNLLCLVVKTTHVAINLHGMRSKNPPNKENVSKSDVSKRKKKWILSLRLVFLNIPFFPPRQKREETKGVKRHSYSPLTASIFLSTSYPKPDFAARSPMFCVFSWFSL